MAETVTVNIPTDPAVLALAARVLLLEKDVADLKVQLAKKLVVDPFSPQFSQSFG